MNKPRILIVEDEKSVARDIRARLTRMGYDVAKVVDDTASALACGAEINPDVVVMDVRLRGGTDGDDFAQEIRRKLSVPVVFLTSDADQRTVDRARSAESFGYVLKPFEDRELQAVIEMAIYKQTVNRELRRANRLYAMLSRVNRAVISARTRPEFLEAVCRIAVEEAHIPIAWVGEYRDVSGVLEAVASWGMDGRGVCTAVEVPVPPKASACPCVNALQRGASVISGPPAGSPRQRACCAAAAFGDLREIAALPIRVADRTWGVFAIYSDRRGSFGPPEVALLEETADAIGFALEHLERQEERRRAEAAIQAQKELFETLLEVIPAPIFHKDPSGRYLRCNEAFARLVGLPRDQILHRAAEEVFPAETARAHREADDILFSEGRGGMQCYEGEIPVRGQDPRSMVFHTSVCCDPSGTPTGIVGVMLDITERKERELALSRSEACHRAVFAETPATMLVVQDGKVVLANPGAARDFGVAAAEFLVGVDVLDYIAPEHHALVRERMVNAHRGIANPPVELRVRRKDGSPTLIESVSVPFSFQGRPAVLITGRDLSERRDAQAAIQENMRRLSTLFSNLPGMAYRGANAPDWPFEFCSEGASQLTGYPPEKFQGPSAVRYGTLIHEHDRQGVRDAIERAIAARTQFSITYRIHTAGGGEKWVLQKGVGVRDHAGNLMAIEGIILDVTERHRAEVALLQSEERFRAIFDQAAVGICQTSPHGRFLRVNARLCEFVGFPARELCQLTLRDITHPDDHAESDAMLERLRAGGLPVFAIEQRWRTAGGDTIWARICISVLRRTSGDSDSIIGVIEDITERVEAELARKQREVELSAIYENAPFMMCLVDSTGRIVRHNRALGTAAAATCEQASAWEPENGVACLVDLQSSRVTCDCGSDDGACLLRQAVREIFQTGTPRAPFECLVRFSGSPRCPGTPVAAAIGLVAVENQPLVLLCMEDVTERKQLERQFLQSQKMEAVGQLAGGVAHDFNNLLAAMFMNLALMRDPRALEAERPEAIAELERLAQRAADLTRQLLLFGRRQVLKVARIDLNELLAGVIRMLRRLLGERIEILLANNPSPLWIDADAGMIEQVIVNFAVNARDAMPRGGRLMIGTDSVEFPDPPEAVAAPRRAGNFVRLRVADTGCGMDAEILRRIFEPFFTTKESGQGTGLGLATVHGIIAQHHGWIEVESTVGKGSAFVVLLPVSTLPARERRDAPEVKAPTRGGTETVLLVEDSEHVRRMMALTLRSYGYTVLETSEGEEAFERWTRDPEIVDIILTDMVMPGTMSGLELVQRMRRIRPGLKAVISSGYSLDLVRKDRSALEHVVFLPKPFPADDLARAVRQAMEA